MESIRKEIGPHEIDKRWTLVRRRLLNGKKTIMSICSFTRKRDPDWRLIKHKYRMCAHGSIQKWGVNYWKIHSLVVNWMSVRAMLTLSILRELHTKPLCFVLTYTQVDLKT